MAVDTTQSNLERYAVANLGCANCAAKIQERFLQTPGLENAVLDFGSATITLHPALVEEAQAIMDSIEPGISIITDATLSAPQNPLLSLPNHRRQLAIIGGAALLFLGGIFFRSQLQQTPYNIGEYAVFLAAYFLVGWPVLATAFRNITRGQVFDENFLMTVATFGAILIGELPEAVGVMLFYSVGEFFQDLAVANSRRSIQALLNIRPDYANLLVNGELRKVAPDTVQPGDILVVKPGERVPLDGEVIKGNSFVDTSALTGEPVPRLLYPGNQILAGMVSTSGVLTIQVTKSYTESSVSRILELVEKASSRKARTEKFITKFARYYTPAVVGVASVIAFLPPLIIPGATLADWVYRALILLVISCPCALVVSIPLGYFAGIGSASRQGILVKGAQFLETLANLHTVVFDKTGTLSQGVFQVTAIKPQGSYSASDLLRIAALAEAHSNHPIAVSIRQAYGHNIDETIIEEYQELPGHGVRANIEGRRVLAGNTKLMEDHDISPAEEYSFGTVVHLAIDGEYAGYITVSDQLRPDAKKTIDGLKKLGVQKTVMLTGDDQSVAQQVAASLDIDEVHANLLPDQKMFHLEELISLEAQQGHKGHIAFVGDGINDAPVISRADVGIAMGGLGSDAAIEAADIVLMDSRPSKVVTAIKVARRTRLIIIENVALALGIKGLFILLGIMGQASMWEAVFADVGVALLAILNSLRVLKPVR